MLQKDASSWTPSGVAVISMYSNNLPGQEPMAKHVTAFWQRIEAMPWLDVDETVCGESFYEKTMAYRLLRSTVST